MLSNIGLSFEIRYCSTILVSLARQTLFVGSYDRHRMNRSGDTPYFELIPSPHEILY